MKRRLSCEESPNLSEAEYRQLVKEKLKVGMICVFNCNDQEENAGSGRPPRKRKQTLEIEGFYRHVVGTWDEFGNYQTFKYSEIYDMIKEDNE